MTVVLDASALLDFLQDEPGGDQVEAVLSEDVISSINWAEVMQKSVAADVLIDGMREDLEALGVKIPPLPPRRPKSPDNSGCKTRQVGLSLRDRACLSLGIRLQAPVLTADQIWTTLKLPITVHSIRPPV